LATQLVSCGKFATPSAERPRTRLRPGYMGRLGRLLGWPAAKVALPIDTTGRQFADEFAVDDEFTRVQNPRGSICCSLSSSSLRPSWMPAAVRETAARGAM